MLAITNPRPHLSMIVIILYIVDLETLLSIVMIILNVMDPGSDLSMVY